MEEEDEEEDWDRFEIEVEATFLVGVLVSSSGSFIALRLSRG